MKLKIEQSACYEETEIDIRCKSLDEQIRQIIDIANRSTKAITVKSDGASKIIKTQSIYYFESVDEKTFVYCRDKVYSSDMKLYEAESLLINTSFVRISKACILNVDVLDSVRVLINGKMEALLLNGEKLIINRHYVPEFKKKFGM